LNKDGVGNLLGRLATHQNLISYAYYNNELIKNEENARAIESLQQYKVLVPRGNNAYTIHATLRRFFDAALNVERLYGIGSDLGASLERLEQLMDALFDVAHEGQAEDRDRIEDEIRQSIYEISDNLAADLTHLRTLVENRFGNVRTLAEKKRQNAYYIGRTEKIVRAIELFTLSDLSERIQTQGAFVNIAAMFQSQLQERLPSFRQNLSDILEILRQYLFNYREIEKRARRVRNLWLHLERYPVYEFNRWDEVANPQSWLSKAAELKVHSHPWVRDPAYTDELASIAKSISESSVRTSTKRPHGDLTEDEQVPVIVLQVKPYRKAIKNLIAKCKSENARVSAIRWYSDHSDDLDGISASVWLQCVLEDLGPRKKKESGITVVTESVSDPVFTGNLTISDVYIEPSGLHEQATH